MTRLLLFEMQFAIRTKKPVKKANTLGNTLQENGIEQFMRHGACGGWLPVYKSHDSTIFWHRRCKFCGHEGYGETPEPREYEDPFTSQSTL